MRKRNINIKAGNETNVKTSSIDSYYTDEDSINIVVNLTSRYMDYFMDDNGNYLYGANDHRVERDHRIVFTKKFNVKQKIGCYIFLFFRNFIEKNDKEMLNI